MTMPSTAAVGKPARTSHLAMGASALALAVLFGAAYAYGSAARAMLDQSEAARIEQESRTFCAGFGLAEQSGPFERCISGLAVIRQQQRERFEAESAGLL